MDSAGRGYWQAGNAFRVDHALRVLEAHERVRGRLLEVYGTEAREDAAIRRLFRPLDPLFPFLSSEQQIAVQRLRRSGIEFSEAEFRETFRLLQQLEAAGVSRKQLLSVREQLRRTLGSRRFAALWATRDPRFSAVQSVGREHDLTEATILSAYEILNDAQDRMVEIVGLASRDAQRAARETQAVRAEQRRRLASLVGPQVADDMLSALGPQSYRLHQQRGAAREGAAPVQPGRPPGG